MKHPSKNIPKTPSPVALLARLGRPGGTHGRRKPARGAAKRRAIQEDKS